MANLVVMHPGEHLSGFRITTASEPLPIGQGEIQIGLFKSQPHGSQERRGTVRMPVDRPHVAPEVVGQRCLSKLGTMGFETLQVEPQVALLILKGGH